MMIGVLDYKYCNSKSVFETLNVLTDDVCYVTDAKQIKNISKLVIPGVGSAKVSLDYLKKNGFTEEIVKFVERGQDILGICLGMQILFKNLSENGISEGLSFFESNVEPISEVSKIKTNIGWRKINMEKKILDIEDNSFYYFCHSFFVELKNSEKKYGVANIAELNKIPAIVNKENIYGFQFHPEKSQKNGIKLLQNFVNL